LATAGSKKQSLSSAGCGAEAAVGVGDEPPELARIGQSGEQEGVFGLVAEAAEDLDGSMDHGQDHPHRR
jgi:hypothetical protein